MCCRILKGERPKRPENCPEMIFRTMKQCWKENATERPDFAGLKMDIQDAYAAETAALAVMEREESASLCVVCMEKQADFAMIPCGHKCVCEIHAAIMCRQGLCPVCRKTVQTFQRIW